LAGGAVIGIDIRSLALPLELLAYFSNSLWLVVLLPPSQVPEIINMYHHACLVFEIGSLGSDA
jgi:hypothetical protein